MQDLESLDGSRAVAGGLEGIGRGGFRGAREVRAGAKIENVGGAHAAQIGNEPVERPIGNGHSVDVDHRHHEATGREQRRKRRGLDSRMDMG